jgi:hypothetical protein
MYNRGGMSLPRGYWSGAVMPTLDERVAYIEGRLEEQSHSFLLRVDGVDAKVDRLDAKVDRLDAKIDAAGQRLDARIDALDAKVSRHFTWLVGIQVTVLIAIVGALLRSIPNP